DERVPRRARGGGGRRDVRPRRRARRPRGLRADPDRQRRAVARAELHRRLVHGGRDRRGGKLAGTVLAAAGIGELNKLIEPALGAVFAKVAILIAVILFLQRRPAGLFATRGRGAEACVGRARAGPTGAGGVAARPRGARAP